MESLLAALAEPSRSNMAMISTREVSLKAPMKMLTKVGMTMRSACGNTTKRMVGQ